MAMGYPQRLATLGKFRLQADLEYGAVTTKGWPAPARLTSDEMLSWGNIS